MSLIAINQAFPFVLIVLSSLALIFHPIQGARAILFFTFGYFLTTAIYSLGFATDYSTRYHPLIIASALTILLYHSLDMTRGLLCAWVIELVLIFLNILMIWDAGVTASLHWRLTIVLNTAEFLILAGNWYVGSGHVIYARRYDLDLPLSAIGIGHRIARAESARLAKAQSR